MPVWGRLKGMHQARRSFALAVGLSLAALPRHAQASDDTLARLVGSAVTSGGASAFLETLTDSVGGRVTGSPESAAAAELLLKALKDAGYTNAHFEEYPLAARWTRGGVAARVSSPVARPLHALSYAWVPGTRGEVEAPLVDLGVSLANEPRLPAAQLRGAAVMVEPQALNGASPPVMRAALAQALGRAGAALMLIPSDKAARLLYTSAFGFFPGGPLPILSIAREDTLLLRRLLARGPVRLAVDVTNSLDRSPSRERNVVADLPGANPDEIVLVGAHLDSWDMAQGADDDGSGVAAVLEAARILKAQGLRPRRTLRFAFFTGEEEALLGSRAYVEAHGAELDRHRAVLIMDSGAQAPRGLQIHGRSDLAPAVGALLAPLAPLGASAVSLDASFDMDHGPFLAEGVPAFSLWVDQGAYDSHHHAITDTFDKVDPRWLSLDTAVMTATAWTLANTEDPGRRLKPTEVHELLTRTGLEPLRALLYNAPAP
jgi:carboxypeptidase Q